MKNIIILLLSIIAACSFEQNSTNYKGLISNGVQYDPKEFPYVTTILLFEDNGANYSVCTGSLITKYFVITATHCLLDKTIKLIRVYAGPMANSKYHKVKQVYIHKDFRLSNPSEGSDVGLIKVSV
ncbi:chymotrypsin-like elastase family member 2A [Acyrthosiphon pisum]|uniref:Peptidase S1 domain-containing protein n=1 Tax=Acyrthosiphon pisum TaxID=7029 RepID=A0A8R2JWG7_ACYPI|nr:chymotrypsin-like elastase family member 2A [Acyrthosiphon pisum]